MMSPLSSHVLFHIGPVPVTQPVVTTWGIMAVLTLGGAWISRTLTSGRPGRLQTLLELGVTALDQQIRETMRTEPAPYRSFVGTLFLFILVANWSSLVPGVEPPTAILATDAALAIIVFLAIIIFGVRSGGVAGYLRSFLWPSVVMVPLNLIGTVTRTFSLMVRLFGNVMAGVFIIGIVLSLAGLLVPIPLMALDLLTGAVQAYIFAILAMVFIAGALTRPAAPQSIKNTGSRS
ncbi:F0F1 ATP synthase subunit A [Gluconobacter sp. R75690]|uniref:F0F1 ATP synthase subunit A n=1 Tax=Gluconobacter TaxID=441 RepID=UPI00188C39C6|nr:MULTISPECIES: F0F1 ATP synthase subunit A [unclassified Gluconobacter]MBF0851119.1 F0F1 ATP synthase subunit A [Gluconobacter sp. R75690]MBF0879811.1 F0F1 ATP synthase subunit A [Gluconobacter sp. R75828]